MPENSTNNISQRMIFLSSSNYINIRMMVKKEEKISLFKAK